MMMISLIDEVTVTIQSGSGGNGAVSWRREKFVAYGGPAGGDGGRGGDVLLEATEDLHTLLDFKYKARYEAPNGARGQSKNMHGRGGDDLVLFVPCGTVVKNPETGQAIADLTTKGQRVLVAQGGRGGRGNPRFATAQNKAPHYAEPGEAGVVRDLVLELKLLADVGLIGMPNAGKSTLISVLSSAKPKIANYPFTTLQPNLGVMRKDTGDGIVLADIPGLIEGASEGVGLGHSFLRHVERCRVLLHLVDATAQDGGTPLENYQIIRNELQFYSPELAKRHEIIVLTKSDAMDTEDFNILLDEFRAAVPSVHIFGISSVARVGLAELKQHMIEQVEAIPRDITKIEVVEDTQATANDDSAIHIEVVDAEEGVYKVHCGKAERWLSITDVNEFQALSRFWHVLKSIGVFNALEAHGAKTGDTVIIGVEMFDYTGQNDTLDEGEFDRYRQGFALNPEEEAFAMEEVASEDEGQLLELSLDDWEELMTHDDSDLNPEEDAAQLQAYVASQATIPK